MPGLVLHKGAEPVTYDGLKALPPPVTTDTHVPTPHYAVIDMVKFALQFYGHEVVSEDYGVTPDGARFFGVISLQSDYGDYTDTVGLRSSVDKKFPIGVSFGSRVFVCDNLAFIGEHVIKRKHTPNAKRDLPGLVAGVIEPLRAQREHQHLTFQAYKQTELSDGQVRDAIMQLYEREVINVTSIADVLTAYREPPCDWGHPSAYRLFNATTYALAGKVAEAPHLTRGLHQIIDSFCEIPDHRQLALV